ncbi:hypothetical protein GGD64_004215 [Bradyrhizobium sp. CIR3A]|nr:hypothetical protein [Bradyrhizobium sp. CIR3A]
MTGPPALVIATVGAAVSSVKTTGTLVVTLALGSKATMLWSPSPARVTARLQTPPEPTVTVPICVVTPLYVSYSVTVLPTKDGSTVPLIV